MKRKFGYFILILVLITNLCGISVAAADADLTIRNWNSDYEKNLSLSTTNGASGTMSGKFEFGGVTSGDITTTKIIGTNVTEVTCHVKWTGKNGKTKSDSDSQSRSATCSVTGGLWAATKSTYHKATIIKGSSAKSKIIEGTR